MKSEEMTQDPIVRIKFGRSGRKHVRLDRPLLGEPENPNAANTDPADEGSRLFRMIWKAIRYDDSDRRRARRHAAEEPEVWLGWWAGDQFGAVSGEVVDISRGGARLIVPDKPPRKQPLWLYKEVDGALTCVRAEVLAVTPSPKGHHSVRLRFEVPCPTSICQAVVCRQPNAPKGLRPSLTE